MANRKIIGTILLAVLSDQIMTCFLILAVCIYYHAVGVTDTAEATVAYIQSHALLSNTMVRLAQIPFVYVMCYRKMQRTEIQKKTEKETNPARWAYLVPCGVSVCFLANMAVNLIINCLVQYTGTEAVAWDAEAFYGGNIVAELVTVALMPALAEELVWRGAVYGGCRRIMNKPAALILSALLFGIMHGNLTQGIYAFILGIVFAVIYDRFGSLWAPVLLHASANAFSVIGSEWSPLSDWMGTTDGCMVLLCASVLCAVAAVPVLGRVKTGIRKRT